MTSCPLAFSRVSSWYDDVMGLNDVTITIAPGVTGLLGPNGAGKSTFLSLASGWRVPALGEVTVFGASPWRSVSARARLGVCPNVDAIWTEDTGVKFVADLLVLGGLPFVDAKSRALGVLEKVNLIQAAHQKVGSYSKGMRQRLRLAQALAHDPDLLLLDEPLSGLDPRERSHVIGLIRGLGDRGKAVVVSSHVLHEVEAMTSRVVLLNKGRVVADGEIEVIRSLLDARPRMLRLRAADPRTLSRALLALEQVRSVELEDDGWMTLRTVSLEAVYDTLHDCAEEYEVSEVYPADGDLQSLFNYLAPQ